LLAPHLRRTHRIARNADNAILLAEKIKRLDSFLSQADDSLWREHALGKHIDLRCVERFDAAHCCDFSALQPYHSTGNALYLSGVVADVDHWHLCFVAQPLEIREDIALAR